MGYCGDSLDHSFIDDFLLLSTSENQLNMKRLPWPSKAAAVAQCYRRGYESRRPESDLGSSTH